MDVTRLGYEDNDEYVDLSDLSGSVASSFHEVQNKKEPKTDIK